jgi:aminopeptidase N
MTPQDETHGHRAFALPGSRLHYGPDKTVKVERIDLHLEPDLEARTLDGICTTSVRALDEPVAMLRVNCVDIEVTGVKVADRTTRFNRHDDVLDVFFEPALAPGAALAFAVTYRVVEPHRGLFFIAPDEAHPHRPRHAWTQSQDQNARYWFPCLDYPHEKQPTQTTVVVPNGAFALANGKLLSRAESGGRTTFVYRQDVPHATYLMTLVVGPFVERQQRNAGERGTPVAFYTLPGREEDGGRSFGNTPDMIEAFETRIGTPYPYARYSQIAVSDFIFGGMENTGATTQTDRTLHDGVAHLDFSSDPLVSHELAHQWFGDLLTCRDWSHAWLNEGFATYFECVWRESNLGYDEYLYDVFGCVERYLREDAARYRRPIVCNRYRAPIELFDRHLYEKGGAVLHMLRGDLGDARFWRSIRHYVATNAQRNVETIDLIRAIEEATGRNMRGFFDRWIFGGGHPEITFSTAWDQKRGVLTATIDQRQTCDENNPPYAFDIELGFLADAPGAVGSNVGHEPLDGERRVRVTVERTHETIAIPLPFEPKLVRFDPGAFVLADVTYELGADAAKAVLQGDPSVVARIRAGRALAKEGSRSAFEAIAEAFAREPFWGVLAEVASSAGATRAPAAASLLRRALGHANPKVRRAVAAALGNFRDADCAGALLPVATGDASYFVRSAALEALGKTRDARAFDVLAAAARERTWNSTVESGALRGLSELADPRAFDLVAASASPRNDEGLRRAAAGAIARIGQLVDTQRTQAVEALDGLAIDPFFLVQVAAIAAMETLGDARHLSTLDRIAQSADDERCRRDAQVAAIRVRESQRVPAQVSGLRSDVDILREEQRKLQEKIESLART